MSCYIEIVLNADKYTIDDKYAKIFPANKSRAGSQSVA